MKVFTLAAILGPATSTQAIQLQKNNWTGYDPDKGYRSKVDYQMNWVFFSFKNKMQVEAPKVWSYDISSGMNSFLLLENHFVGVSCASLMSESRLLRHIVI